MAPYISHSDNELCRLVAQSDEAAFTELFRRYDKRIYPFVLKMLKTASHAEEVTQEIFIKLWLHREKLAAIENPPAYIFTIASRHTLDHIRKILNERKMLNGLSQKLQRSGEGSNDTDELLLLKESETLVREALQKLPPQQQKVFILSRQQGLSNEEIAIQLRLARFTVRNHLKEALRNIRHFLKEKGQVIPFWAALLLMHAGFF